MLCYIANNSLFVSWKIVCPLTTHTKAFSRNTRVSIYKSALAALAFASGVNVWLKVKVNTRKVQIENKWARPCLRLGDERGIQESSETHNTPDVGASHYVAARGEWVGSEGSRPGSAAILLLPPRAAPAQQAWINQLSYIKLSNLGAIAASERWLFANGRLTLRARPVLEQTHFHSLWCFQPPAA